MEGPNDYGIAIFINGTQQTLYHFDTGTGDWMDDCPVGSLIVGNIDGYWNNNRGLDGTLSVFRWYNYDASGSFASNYASDQAIWAAANAATTLSISAPASAIQNQNFTISGALSSASQYLGDSTEFTHAAPSASTVDKSVTGVSATTSGVSGATISLRNADTNAVIATTTTDGSGNYSFSTSSSTLGSADFKTTFAGDATYSASTSSEVTVTISGTLYDVDGALVTNCQVEFIGSSFPSSGTTITNVGQASGENGTAHQNDYLLIKANDQAWALTNNTSEKISTPSTAAVDDLANISLEFLFYWKGASSGGDNPPDFGNVLLSKGGGSQSCYFQVFVDPSTNRLYVGKVCSGSGSPMWDMWDTPANSVSPNSWNFVQVTWANGGAGAAVGATPIVYINNTNIIMGHAVVGTGTWLSDATYPITLGNYSDGGYQLYATLALFRLHNAILTSGVGSQLAGNYNASKWRETTLQPSRETVTLSVIEHYATQIIGGNKRVNSAETVALSVSEKSTWVPSAQLVVASDETITLNVQEVANAQTIGYAYVSSTETFTLSVSELSSTNTLPAYTSTETLTLSVSESVTLGMSSSETITLSVSESSSIPAITAYETIALKVSERSSVGTNASKVSSLEVVTLSIVETSDANIIYVPTQEPPITVPYTLEVRQRNPGWQVVNGGAPAACSSAPGRDDVFFSSKVDGDVLYITSADGYESALDLQGMIVSSVSAVSPAENQIFVFAQGLTRGVYYKASFDGGTTWGEWEGLGGTLAANAGPSVCMDAEGKINVFAVGKGNALFYLKGTPGTTHLQSQGLSFDGTYYYYVTTWSIYKLDQSMNVVMYREGVGALCGGNHLGGCGLNDDILYCFCTSDTEPQVMMVGLFNTSDLSFITRYDLCKLSGLTSDELHIGAVGIDAENNCLLGIQYGIAGSTAFEHTKVFKFNLDTFAYEGSIAGTGPTNIYYNGVCAYNGKYYYSVDDYIAMRGNPGGVGMMNPDGSGESIIIPQSRLTYGGEVEGLCVTSAGILVPCGSWVYTFSTTYPYTLLNTQQTIAVPTINSPSAWQQLGGAASSSPAACYYETGICVFVRGTDGACWYRWSADNTTWHPWYSLGGQLHPGTGPAAVSMTSGRVDLYCVGSDNSIWTKSNTSSNWTTSGAWVNIGGPVTSTLAAASNNENEITLFGRGQDGALWYTEWTPASVGIAGWSKWAKLINRAFNYIGVLDGRIAPQIQQELGNADLLTFNLNIDSPLVPALSGNPKGYEIWWYGRDNQFKQAFVLQKVEAYGDFGGVQGSGGSTLGAGSGYNLLVTADGPEEYLNRYNIAFEYKSSQRMTLQVLQDISTEILNDGFITGIYVDPTLNMPLDVDLSWETIKTGIDKIIQQTGGYCRVYIPPSDPSKRILTLASTFAAIQNSYDPVNVTNAAQVIYDYFPSQGLLIPNDGGVAGADGDGVASSPGYYELTNNGAPAWQFQDTTDYIVIPDVPELENLYNFTFQAIFRIDAAGATNYSYIYSKGGFVIAWVDSSARILVQRTTTGTGSGTMDQYIMSTTGTVNIGQWNYIQIAWDSSLGPGIGVPVMYLNGKAVSLTHSKVGAGAWTSDIGDDIYIGNDVTLAYNSAMTLSYLSLHSTALDPDALKAEYAANNWREGVNSESSEVEYSTWPSSGVTIINSGNAGGDYNATAQQSDYATLSSGAGMWAFNGTTDYIEAPHGGAIDNTSATTFEFLFNLNETSTAGRLWSKQQQLGLWEVWIDENNQYIVTSRTTANSDKVTYNTPINSIELGTWYDLQIVWPWTPATAPSIYLNNTPQTLSQTASSAASSWSNDGWSMLNGTGPAACSWGGGRKDVFMVGSNGTVSHTWDDGNGGTGLENLGGTLTTTPAATSPTANTIHLFGRGSNGYCYWNKWNGTSWSGWVSLGGTLYPNAGLTACSYGSRIDVFVEGGTAGSLYQNTSTNGGSTWGGWVHITSATIDSGPTAVATGSGDITLFAQGADGTLYSMSTTNGGSSWSTWASIWSSPLATGVAPSACVTSDGYIAVCFEDGTGNANVITNESGSWQGTSLGGSLNAQPAIIAPSTLELDAYINQNTQLYTNTSTDDGNTWGDWTIDGDFNIYLGNNKAQTNNLNCSLALYREHSSALSADQLSNNYNSDQWILYGSYNPSGFHTDQPPIITIGKNATGVDVQSDYSSIITKLYPRGAGSAPGELTLNSPPYFQPMVRLKNPTIVDQYVYFSVEPDNEYVSYNNFEMGVSPRSAGMLIGRGRKQLGAYTDWIPVANGLAADAMQENPSDPNRYDLPAWVGGWSNTTGTWNYAAAQMFNIPQGGAQITDISLLLWRYDPSKNPVKGLVNQTDLLEYTRLIEQTGGAIKFCVGIYNSVKQDKRGVLEPYQGPLLWYVGDFFSIASDNFRWYNFPLQGAWLATGTYWVVMSLYPSSVAFSDYSGSLEWGGIWRKTNPGFSAAALTSAGIKHNAWEVYTGPPATGYYNLDTIINEINTDVTDQFFFVDEKTIGIIASNYIPTDEYYVAYPLAPWLSNQDAIDKYGMIEGTYKDDTATSQDALLKSGTQYLTKVSQPILSWSVGVVDLYDLNPTINWSEELKLGTNVLVMDEKLGVNELCMISKLQKTNLDTPHDIQLTLDAIYKNTPRLLAETMGDLQDKPKYEGGQVVATPYTLTTQADTNNPAWFEFEIRPSTTRVHSVEFSLNSQPFQAAGTGGLTTGSATSASGHVIEIDGTTVNSLSGECGSMDILPFLTLNHAGTPTPGWHYIKVTPPKG